MRAVLFEGALVGFPNAHRRPRSEFVTSPHIASAYHHSLVHKLICIPHVDIVTKETFFFTPNTPYYTIALLRVHHSTYL
jgi:hypothetical protein